jgi:chemotaxis protein MotC
MPYSMLRSLQFVQDSVAKGDHSATEMQRFLLQTIDERLKARPRRSSKTHAMSMRR